MRVIGLFDYFSSKPAEDAAAARATGFNAGYGQLSDLYGQGRSALTSNTNQGIGLYSNLLAGNQAGANAYGDASGANGAGGLATARGLFTATPGYQEGLDQTLNQNDRRAASRGMLGSGNTAVDTAKLTTGYINQQYGDYVNRLQPYLGANGAGVSGAAGLYQGLGSGLANSFQGQGQAAQATQTGIGNANADAALAPYQASGNFWNTALGAAQAAASIATGVPIPPKKQS